MSEWLNGFVSEIIQVFEEFLDMYDARIIDDAEPPHNPAIIKGKPYYELKAMLKDELRKNNYGVINMEMLQEVKGYLELVYDEYQELAYKVDGTTVDKMEDLHIALDKTYELFMELYEDSTIKTPPKPVKSKKNEGTRSKRHL